MIRSDGSLVAGYHLGGARSYFMDDDGRNDTKKLLESLFLTIPEESMRVQFHYEVVENIGSLLDDYAAAQDLDIGPRHLNGSAEDRWVAHRR